MTKQKEDLIEFFNYLYLHTDLNVTVNQTRNSLIDGFLEEQNKC